MTSYWRLRPEGVPLCTDTDIGEIEARSRCTDAERRYEIATRNAKRVHGWRIRQMQAALKTYIDAQRRQRDEAAQFGTTDTSSANARRVARLHAARKQA